MLDTALEFCRASNDFWEQGDIENAITALDQAYSLILKINAEKTRFTSTEGRPAFFHI